MNAAATFSRFLVDKSDFKVASGSPSFVKPSAFMPRPNKATQRLETSVFATGDLQRVNEPAIWQLGLAYVMPYCPPQKKLYGRADVGAEDIASAGLNIEEDNRPPRHANIIGWSSEKDAQKESALLLANAAGAPILNLDMQ